MMRPKLNPCPRCGAGVNDNEPGTKKEIKITFHAPIKGIRKERKGCSSIIIRCKNCGLQVGPYYQKRVDKKIVETVDELKERTAAEWNRKSQN